MPCFLGIKKLRTSFLVEKLIERGHEVVWWSSAFDHFGKKWLDLSFIKTQEEFGRVRFILLRGCGYKKNVSLRRYLDHRLVARRFCERAYRETLPDIIIASLPSHDLVYEGVRFGQKVRIPVIVDVRDPWPDVFLEALPHWVSMVARGFLGRDFKMLKEALTGATSILACTNTFLGWALEKAGRSCQPGDRVFPLGAELNPRGVVRTHNPDTPFVVAFVGTFSSFHNPEILVECAERMKAENIQFILAGNGIHLDRLQKRGAHSPNVHFPGWLGEREIQSLLQHAHVGVCPSNRPAPLFPNKAFTYLSAGLPVLSSFGGDLHSWIEKEKFGFNYPPDDVGALCHFIRLLVSNKETYEEMSRRALSVFNAHFTVEKIYNSYVDHVECVAQRERGLLSQ